MLIAILTDIHANREAFAACLAHAETQGIGRYVLLGDFVGYGADPVWVIERVMDLAARGAVAILGNHDEAVLVRSGRMNEHAQAAIDWTRGKLGTAHREFLRSLPLTWENRGHLYVHASAAALGTWPYVSNRYAAELSFRATSCAITICGHVHVPALYNLSPIGELGEFTPVPRVAIALAPPRRWLAVIGSVGQPRDCNPAACYAVLDDQTDLLTYIRVPYDIKSAARKIRAAGLPDILAARLETGR